jgi:uncharacterized membrane protein
MALTIETTHPQPNPLAGTYSGTPATQPVEAASPPQINVGTGERIASTVGGGLLMLYGLSRRSLAGLALAAVGNGFLCRGLSGRCAVYRQLGINTADRPVSAGKFTASVIVRRSALDCYLFWRHLDNVTRFMSMVESVRVIDDRHSHWEMTPLGGEHLKYDTFIYRDVIGEEIHWRTLPGATLGMAGSITFTGNPDLDLTEVTCEVRLAGSNCRNRQALARRFGLMTDQHLARDLQRFKDLLEAGEIIPDSMGYGHRPRWQKSEDVVDTASDQSFPASDSPAWAQR